MNDITKRIMYKSEKISWEDDRKYEENNEDNNDNKDKDKEGDRDDTKNEMGVNDLYNEERITGRGSNSNTMDG